MKRQRSFDAIELDDEDEGNEFKPLPDNSETPGPAPIPLSDDTDEDELVITSGPPQNRPEVSPAKEPPTPMPRKDPAPLIILDDDDDDEKWPKPAPAKLPSTEPDPESYAALALCLLRLESMTMQERSPPEAIRRAEGQARIHAQKRPELVPSLLVLNTPSSSTARGKAPLIEEEKILIEVINKDGDIQPIRIFMTDKFEKLFRVYAEVYDLSLPNLSFRFNGDNLDPNSTPQDHSMKDGELIGVYNMI